MKLKDHAGLAGATVTLLVAIVAATWHLGRSLASVDAVDQLQMAVEQRATDDDVDDAIADAVNDVASDIAAIRTAVERNTTDLTRDIAAIRGNVVEINDTIQTLDSKLTRHIELTRQQLTGILLCLLTSENGQLQMPGGGPLNLIEESCARALNVLYPDAVPPPGD